MAIKFEDFPIYKKVLAHTKNIYSLMDKTELSKEFELKNQVKRAVLSISNNIAEGSEYNNNRQFIRFLTYAKGSCAEVRNMLNICYELAFISLSEKEGLVRESKDISVSLSKFIHYLQSNDKRTSQ